MIEFFFFFFALIMRQFPSRVHKLNVELYKLQAIETNYAERRVLQAACVAVLKKEEEKKKKEPDFSSYFIHLLVSESVSVLPA